MELTMLTVLACPNAAAFEERLAAALAGHPDAVARGREIADEMEAAAASMHGFACSDSPTPVTAAPAGAAGPVPAAPRRAFALRRRLLPGTAAADGAARICCARPGSDIVSNV